MSTFKVTLLQDGIIPPKQATNGSVGWDVYSPIDVEIPPHDNKLVPLGFQVELEPGTWAMLRDRSSVARQKTLVVGGVIDEDYRGEVKIILHNLSPYPTRFPKHARIGQMIIFRNNKDNIAVTADAPETKTDRRTQTDSADSQRGTGGFGSTGQ